MSRDNLKSRFRPKPDAAAPFQTVLEQLHGQREVPSGVISRGRAMPASGWPYPAAEAATSSPAAATAEVYFDLDLQGTAPEAAPLSVEEAVARELQLSDGLEPAELERIRRRFAYRNHPDRVGPSHKSAALRRMTVANVLVDQALKAARARAR